MASPRNAGREILLSLLAASVFAVAFGAYMLSSAPRPSGPVLAAPAEPPAGSAGVAAPRAPQTPPELVQAQTVIEPFALALASQRYEDAYALMAAPYRAAHSLDAFKQSCQRSSLLSTVQRAVVLGTSRSMLGSGTPGPYSEQARGVLMTGAGAIEARYTLLVDGKDARILVLSLAGVPVLDGVSKQ